MLKSFEYLCLFCIRAFRGERTSSAIYHLLKGKKSSQTIQDGNLYSLAFLFGLLPDLSRAELDSTIARFEQDQLISFQDDFYYLTEKGSTVLEKEAENFPFPDYLNGWKYKGKADVFWKRYSLLTQTLSNLQMGRTDFIPVQYEETVQHFVKKILLQDGIAKKELCEIIYKETFDILGSVGDQQAYIFVSKLSGHLHSGLTLLQISKMLGIDETWVRLEFQAALHYMLQKIERKVDHYPVLSKLCSDMIHRPNLTATTQKTFYLLERGYKLEEIAAARNLKQSTIEDHIVELALHLDSFSISPYVPKERAQIIQQAAYSLKTNQLKRIKEYLGLADVSYFQIRLVLTKMGDAHG